MDTTWRVDSLNSLDKLAWTRLEDSSIPSSYCGFQKLQWAEAAYVADRQRSLFLTVLKDGDMIGGMRFWIEENTLGFNLTSSGGPICIPQREQDVAIGISQFLKAYAHRYVFDHIVISPVFRGNLSNMGIHRIAPPTLTSLIDLRKSEDALWDELQKSARWGVNKAKRNGLIVSELTTVADWGLFYEMQLKHQQEKQYLRALTSRFTQVLRDSLRRSNLCVLLGCFFNEILVACVLLQLSNGYAIYYRGSSLKDFRRYNPSDLLQWESILWAKGHGYTIYDLGGMPFGDGPKSGLAHYKRKWGGSIVQIPEFSERTIYRKVLGVNRKYGTLSRLRGRLSRNT